MPSTANSWRLIGRRVGEGGATAGGSDVLTVQQLLAAAGSTEPALVGGSWGPASKRALTAFQKAHRLPEQNFVEPDDRCLYELADAAKILVPLPNLLGISGVKTLHNWFREEKIQYQQGAQSGGGNRALYAFDWNGCRDYAIQRINQAWRTGPVQMDCTTYVNCMLSVFLHGNLHSAPYEASCAAYGNISNNHMARERYKMPLVMRKSTKNGVAKEENYFKEAEDIAAAAVSSAMYVIEVGGGAGGGVTHMALLYGGETYECTTGQSGPACINRPLAEFVKAKHGKILYLFGPMVG